MWGRRGGGGIRISKQNNYLRIGSRRGYMWSLTPVGHVLKVVNGGPYIGVPWWWWVWGGGVHAKNRKVTNFQSFLVLKTILENYELN